MYKTGGKTSKNGEKLEFTDDDIEHEGVCGLVLLAELGPPARHQAALLLQHGLRDAEEVAGDVDVDPQHQADLGQDQLHQSETSTAAAVRQSQPTCSVRMLMWLMLPVANFP